MMSFPRGAVVAASLIGSTLTLPLADKLKRLSPEAREVLKRLTPTAPRFVTYSDAWVSSIPSASQLQGYNVYAFSFWTSSKGAVDMALAWQNLPDGERSIYLQEYGKAGISLIAAAFGSTDTPTATDADTVASNLANWVTKYGLQGVDIQYEDMNMFRNTGKAEPWLISLTKQLRVKLPQGQYILSHAPIAPWFTLNRWDGGGYLNVHTTVGLLIDWYNVQGADLMNYQFYNQGTEEYTTCDTLLTVSSSTWPQTALFQISVNGVDLNKLVIGKPATPSDASNGYMSPQTLASCVSQAQQKNWNAGVMVWQYPHATSSWINTVRGNT